MSEAPPPILDYGQPPVPLRWIVRRLWWAVLISLIVFLIGLVLLFNYPLEFQEWLGVGIAGTPFFKIDWPDKWLALGSSIYLIVLVIFQFLLLAPRGTLRIRLETAGRPMLRSAIAAAFIAMLLTTGLLATLLEIPFPTEAAVPPEEGTFWTDLTLNRGSDKDQYFGVVWISMLTFWLVWAIIFYRYGGSLDRHTWLTRVFRFLIAGTVLEMLVAAPAHAYIARREDCYCARGSWTGMVFGVTAAIWLFGPGLFFLFLREKRRLERVRSVGPIS